MHGYSQILTPNPRGPDCLTAVDASVVQGHPACQFMSWSVPPAQLGCDQCSPPQRPPGSCGGPLVEHRRLRSLRCSWDACESDHRTPMHAVLPRCTSGCVCACVRRGQGRKTQRAYSARINSMAQETAQ